MPDFLGKLIEDAKRRVKAGYYERLSKVAHNPVSLKKAVRSVKGNAIIAEIKPVSPALGPLRPDIDPVEAASDLERGGAVALSILTEPDNFGGRLENLAKVRRSVSIPLIMKDVIIDGVQIEAGGRLGADCILLIEPAFSDYETGSLEDAIRKTHELRLEVLLEVHTEDQLKRALQSEADLIGINNRDLRNLKVDLETTLRLTSDLSPPQGKMLISESGIETADDLRKLKASKVDGFLIGSSLMLSPSPEGKVREFVSA